MRYSNPVTFIIYDNLYDFRQNTLFEAETATLHTKYFLFFFRINIPGCKTPAK